MDATPHPLIPAGHADDVHRASVWVGDAMRLPNEVDVLRARVAELEERVVKQATTITGYQARIEEAGPVSKRDEGRCLSLIEERDSLHEEVERLKSELAWVTETELGLAKQKQNLNRAKLQAVYDALAEHCQTAKHPSPLLLEQLQSLYRLLEDPA